jgi:uncharacterized integral membrane protein
MATIIILFILLTLVAIFSMQNATPVAITSFGGSRHPSQ